jgi:hypothetical protein
MNKNKYNNDSMKKLLIEIKECKIEKFKNNLNNEFKFLSKKDDSLPRYKIIFKILSLVYNNYDLCPFELKSVINERCMYLKDEAFEIISDNEFQKYPWYKIKNKYLRKIILLCNSIIN